MGLFRQRLLQQYVVVSHLGAYYMDVPSAIPVGLYVGEVSVLNQVES